MNDASSVNGRQNTELSRHSRRRGGQSRGGDSSATMVEVSSNSRQRASRIQEKKEEQVERRSTPHEIQRGFLIRNKPPLSQIKMTTRRKEGRREGKGRERWSREKKRMRRNKREDQEQRPSLPISPLTNRNRHRAPPARSDPRPNKSLPTMAADASRCPQMRADATASYLEFRGLTRRTGAGDDGRRVAANNGL
jgi:hypothetical protein